MSNSSYDLIILGSGAGGGTLALKLAPSGQRILILERGDYLPREKQNWDVTEIFVKNRYVSIAVFAACVARGPAGVVTEISRARI